MADFTFDKSRFEAFTILSTPYKTVHEQDVDLAVLYPTKFTPAADGQPVIIRFHGGGLVGGDNLIPDLFSRWILELAQRHSAIIVSINNRLLPEADSNDVLEDVEDAWQWVQTKLASFLDAKTDAKVKPDTSRILTAGESAGGYLSLILSLSHPDKIRATTAAYPMVDIKDRWYSEAFEKQLFEVPQLPIDIYNGHLEAIKAQEKALGAGSDGKPKKLVVSTDPKFQRATLMFVFIQHGLFPQYFDSSTNKAYPLERVQAGDRFPKGGVFVWHGTQDSLVPIAHSRELAKKVQELQPDTKFVLSEQPGDHGFDADTTLEDAWFKEGLDPLVKAWLA